jgi:dUTP pyrophosphatase
MLPHSILVKRLAHAEGLALPAKMTKGASGFDMVAAVPHDITILPGQRMLVPTGFCFEIPPGHEVQIRPRSGLAIRNGITVLNAPGTIDADYRGEVKIILINLGQEPFTIRRGDRIAQAVALRVASELAFAESGQIGETARGDGGFGHSGI